jgi:hypothetical protein
MIERPVIVIVEVTVNRDSQSPTLFGEHIGPAISRVASTITINRVITVNWGTLSS